MHITRQLRDAFVNLDADTHNPLPTAEALAFLGRFYLDTMRSVNPDCFYGLGNDQNDLAELQSIVLAFESMVRAHRHLFVEDLGGGDGFMAWAAETTPQQYDYTGGEYK